MVRGGVERARRPARTQAAVPPAGVSGAGRWGGVGTACYDYVGLEGGVRCHDYESAACAGGHCCRKTRAYLFSWCIGTIGVGDNRGDWRSQGKAVAAKESRSNCRHRALSCSF